MAIQKVDDDLKSLGKVKDYIMKVLYNNEDVRNLTMPSLDDDRFDSVDNFFGGKNLEYYNPTTKKYEYADLLGHCFDVPYIDETITDSRALITMDSYIPELPSEHIKTIALDMFVFSHKSFIHMNSKEKASYSKRGYAGNRVDMIVSAIELALKEANQIVNRPKDFGIGKIVMRERSPITPYEPNKEFYGKKISLLCSDFFEKPKNKR